MGIKEVLMQKLGIGIENKQVVQNKVVREQTQGYEISAVCDNEEEIGQNVGGLIGIGGDDDE